MIRVLKPNGIVLWFDFRLNNPRNPDVLGIGKREIRQLFGASRFVFRTRFFTAISPSNRAMVELLVESLGKVPLLCSHYVAVIRQAMPVTWRSW